MNEEKERVKRSLARWEEEQEVVNKKKDEFNKTLKGLDKNKLEAVEQSIKILTDAEVPFLMFCQQKHFNSKQEVSVQYNNFGELTKKLGQSGEVINWIHNVTLSIWSYICETAEHYGDIKKYNPVDLWFWGSVKDEYRKQHYTLKQKHLKSKYPVQ